MSIPLLPASERTFAAVYKRMVAARKAMPQSCEFVKRPRRKSGVAGITPIEPPEPEILKPLACGGIDGIDGDPEEPEITIPEVCQPFVSIEAGADDEISEPGESSDSDGEEQDGGYAEAHEE